MVSRGTLGTCDKPRRLMTFLWVGIKNALFAAYVFSQNVDSASQEATTSSESLFRELRFSLFLSEQFAFCSALVSLSTKRSVSLADNSPSSPHLRLDRSGGHIGRLGLLEKETKGIRAAVVPIPCQNLWKKYLSIGFGGAQSLFFSPIKGFYHLFS